MILNLDLKCMKCSHKGKISEIVVIIRDIKELNPICRLCGNTKNEYFEVLNVSLGGK